MAKSPDEVANIGGVIELKNKIFSNLEKRAGECSIALATLEKKSDEDKNIALREAAALKAELGESERVIADLRRS